MMHTLFYADNSFALVDIATDSTWTVSRNAPRFERGYVQTDSNGQVVAWGLLDVQGLYARYKGVAHAELLLVINARTRAYINWGQTNLHVDNSDGKQHVIVDVLTGDFENKLNPVVTITQRLMVDGRGNSPLDMALRNNSGWRAKI